MGLPAPHLHNNPCAGVGPTVGSGVGSGVGAKVGGSFDLSCLDDCLPSYNSASSRSAPNGSTSSCYPVNTPTPAIATATTRQSPIDSRDQTDFEELPAYSVTNPYPASALDQANEVIMIEKIITLLIFSK